MFVRQLLAGDVVTVHEVWCDDRPERETAPEQASASQVVLPHRGVFVRHVRGRAVVATPAVAVFYNAGEVGNISHPVAHGDANTVLTPSERALEGLVPVTGSLPSCARPLDGSTMLAHTALRHRLLGAIDDDDRLAVEELSLRLMAAAVRVPERSSAGATARHRRIAALVEATLTHRFREPISLADLADGASASVYEVSRAVRRVTGRSVSELRSLLRFRHALNHLADDGVTLASLAADAGYSDQAHMTREFRRHAQTTPADSRQRVHAIARKIVQDGSVRHDGVSGHALRPDAPSR